MCISLLKICALGLLHRGSLKYFENPNGRLNGLRATNSDSSVGMMRLKEQKAIFTGLWITFWWLFKAQKSLSRKFPRGFFFLKRFNFLLFKTSWISESYTHMRILFLLFASEWIDREGLGKHCTQSVHLVTISISCNSTTFNTGEASKYRSEGLPW